MADDHHGAAPVHMPSSTPWPLVMALGITLIPGGFLLGPRLGEAGALQWISPVSLVGLVLFFLALYKMIRQDIDEAAAGTGHG
jgi:hypothetical protein